MADAPFAFHRQMHEYYYTLFFYMFQIYLFSAVYVMENVREQVNKFDETDNKPALATLATKAN